MSHNILKPESFGIVGAMEPEIALLKNALHHCQSHQIGHVTIYTGNLNGKSVALCLSGIGKVNAAIATTLLIEHFAPDCIINTGSAGAIAQGLNIGDVVIGVESVHHDVDVTAFGYAYGQLPQQPARYTAHSTLISAAELAINQLPHLRHIRGVIASGDQFIHGEQSLQLIRERFNDVVAVEMEAAAIAQTCHQANKPFVIIRAISDNADHDAEISFEQFLQTAATHSAQMVQYLIAVL